MKILLAAMAAVLATAVPANAANAQFEARGVLSGTYYGGSQASAFFSQVPVGSPFSFKFSYDAATPRTSGGFAGGLFYQLPLNASFKLGGVDFALPQASVFIDNGLGGSRPKFSIFTNFPLGSPQLSGFRPIDFRFDLLDGIGTPIIGTSLPTSLSLADFQDRSLKIRIADSSGSGAEAGLLFMPTSLTTLTSAVPEPASWSMLLAGFGLMGSALRHRKRSGNTIDFGRNRRHNT